MKMLRRALIITTGAGVAAVAIIAAMALSNPKEWPGFPEIKGDRPAYVVEYCERDFGWRTGNLVPITISFKVPAGTTLDAENLTVQGDMTLVERRITTQKGEEDLTYIRVEMQLQSMIYMQKWNTTVNVSYREHGGKWQKLQVEPLEVYSSKTFDGRKRHPEDPSMERRHGLHAVWTFTLLSAGLIGTVFSVGVIIRRPKTRKKMSPKQAVHPWTEIDKAWRRLREGDQNPETLRTIAASLRFYFKAQSASIDDLISTGNPLNQQVARVLEVVENSIWTGTPPDQEKLTELDGVLDSIRPAKRSEPQPVIQNGGSPPSDSTQDSDSSK